MPRCLLWVNNSRKHGIQFPAALPPKADMLERMSPDNMTTALDCFDALPSQQAKAIWRALAGG
jgi:hypothetical protein